MCNYGLQTHRNRGGSLHEGVHAQKSQTQLRAINLVISLGPRCQTAPVNAVLSPIENPTPDSPLTVQSLLGHVVMANTRGVAVYPPLLLQFRHYPRNDSIALESCSAAPIRSVGSVCVINRYRICRGCCQDNLKLNDNPTQGPGPRLF